MSDRDIVGSLSNEPSITGQLQPDIIISGKMDARFPASVTALSPILLDRTGANYQFSLDMNAVVASLPPGGVSSVFGRTGDITAQSGDYTFAQIGSKPTTVSGYGITDAVTLTGAETLTNKTLTSPLISKVIGGTGTGSSLDLQSTSGVGATDFVRILGGNNGAKEIARFFTDGRAAIGSTTASGNNLLLNNNGTSAPTTPAAATSLHIIAANSTTAGIQTDGFAGGGAWVARRTGGTAASPSDTPTGSSFFQFVGVGYANSAYGINNSLMQFRSNENYTATAQGSLITFGATPVGTAARVEVFQLTGTAAYFPVIQTTASAANAFLDSGSTPVNELKRSTSSLVYKRDVEAVAPDYADRVLDLAPIWYRSKAAGDNQDWSWYGLGAEDVAAIDPRLVFWGYQDRDYESITVEGEDGDVTSQRVLKPDAKKKPDGVMYDRVAVLLLDVVKREKSRNDDLEKRLEAIESRLANQDLSSRDA